MQLDFELLAQQNFEFSQALPINYKGHVLPGSDVLIARNPSLGTVVQQQLTNKHYTIRYIFFDVLEPFKLRGFQPGARLISFLSVNNTIDYEIEGVGSLKLRQGQFAMLHTKDRPAAANFLKAKSYECIEIAWSDDWIKAVSHKFLFLRSLFLPMNKSVKGYFLDPKPRPAGIRALDMVKTMLTTPYDPDISRMFFKSHAHEYMLLLLIESTKKTSPLMHLTEKQRETLISIGNQIRTGFDKQFYIAELSRQAGMNATTLKKGFREIHGGSISRVHMTARMNEARRLLTEKELNTKQIAEKVGYELTTSFIKNFKKFFGYNPSEVSRNG